MFVWAKLNDPSIAAEKFIDQTFMKRIYLLPLEQYLAHRARAISVSHFALMKIKSEPL